MLFALTSVALAAVLNWSPAVMLGQTPAPANPTPSVTKTPDSKAADPKPTDAKTQDAKPPISDADKSTAYYHAALADYYEDMATNFGRQDYVTRAVEEYKLALNADPDSTSLATSLAELYFRAGRAKEAIQTTQEVIKKSPDNLAAHKLLGRIYLRSLGQQESGQPNSPNGQMLELAIAEFTKIITLEPKSIEDRLLLGQLYTVKHDTAKAEAQFKAAQEIEPASEEVVLNLARLYAETGDMKRSAELLEAVPVSDRTPKEEFALGGTYEQLKQNKKA
ncbi:MAG TPA: tetratricopeptide repeat protein, partial [Acidobacteriaceae bacterium]